MAIFNHWLILIYIFGLLSIVIIFTNLIGAFLSENNVPRKMLSLRGISSFFGVNFDISEKEFNKLYKSINLTGKLIILEDLERSGIDILVIMGYINNLVEQDGVKILIVANENEILYKENLQIDEKGKETKLKVLKENAQEYRRVKEKTIRDTLIFYVDLDESIKSILNLFEYNYFDTNYDKTELVEAIENMFQQLRKKR